MTTMENNRGHRVVKIRSFRTSVTVWKPIRGRNRPNASSAVTAASLNARTVSTRMPGASPPISDLFDIRAAKQTLRQEEKSDRQNRKGGNSFVVDREICRPHGLDQSDQY